MLLPARLLVVFLFFLSGFAALIYQVAWQRLLVVFAGGDVMSITIIVTAFMAGLGCGSFCGGSLADRGTRRTNLLWFACAEGLIAVFGLLSKTIFYDVLYLQMGGIAGSRALTAVVLVVALLLPTFLMGLSLPLLARALIQWLPDAAVQTGRLYGMNTLGAAAGALITTWMLLPLQGIEGAIQTAALLNGICALGMLPLLKSRAQDPADKELSAVSDTPSRLSLRSCLLLYALSGFIALALEMLWFRLLGGMLKSTAFTFGTLLSVYLFGVGAGSLAGTWLAPRTSRPTLWFLIAQCGIGLYAGFVTAGVLMALNGWPSLAWLRDYLGSYEPVDANTAVLLLQEWWSGTLSPVSAAKVGIFPIMHGLLPLLLIGPATLLMGISYPMLQKAVQSDVAYAGRRVGWIQTANIVGSMLGAIWVGTWLLPMYGSSMTLKLLVALAGVFGVMLLFIPGSSVAKAVRWTMIILVAGAVLALPDNQTLWARIHGVAAARIYLAEDGAGVSVLKKPASGDPADVTEVFVNGIGQSWIPFGGIHSALGALPVLMHPKPEDIAIIGLGSGDTLFSASSRHETHSIVCVEIVGAELETLRQHSAHFPYEGLKRLLADERIRHVAGDGRRYLMTTERRFDLIEADALRPTSAHAGNLYSEEYFRLLLSRLKPGGFAVTWVPTRRVHETFVSVFPHVLVLPHMIVGSNQPVPWDPELLRLRLSHLEHRHHFASAGIDLPQLVAAFLEPRIQVEVIGPDFDRSQFSSLNTDLFPRDELALPALWGNP